MTGAGLAVEALRSRLIPLLPCAIGLGIVVYFALPTEPALLPVLVMVGAGLVAVAVLGRVTPALWPAGLLAAAALVGFAAAQLRTVSVDAPAVLRQDLRTGIEGTIESVETLPVGLRVVLGDLHLDAPELATAPPHRIRLRINSPPESGLAVGDRIRVFGMLGPPSAPLLPGGFDFRRHAFFGDLGGVGVAFGRPEVLGRVEPGWTDLGTRLIEPLRDDLAARIRTTLEGDVAAVAVAFMTGQRAGISDAANEAMRDSGLAHLLSISGVHVNLVALLVFVGLRFLLAAIEPVALRWPIKKWAALAALAAILAYTVMVGGSVPTVRACIMTGIVLLAVMIDRVAFSIRLIAIAAAIVLLTTPDAMLGPSFQMSFAAVLALIAGYEAIRRRGLLTRMASGPAGRASWYLLGIVLTTLIATAATAPFAIYHFQRFSLVATVANLLAMPLTSLLIMPAVLLAYPAIALGIGDLALVPLGWGMGLMLDIARWTASWPGAAISIPAMPDWGLAAAVIGGLWLCLAQGRVRMVGLAGLLLAAASVAQTRPPDILISADATLAAIRLEDGRWSFSTRRAERFAREQWLRYLAAEEGERWPERGEAADGALRCDPAGCILRRDGLIIAFPRSYDALVEDCAMADLVVYRHRAPRACVEATTVIDGPRLRETGALAISLGSGRAGGLSIASVREATGSRPWTPWRDPAIVPGAAAEMASVVAADQPDEAALDLNAVGSE